jgi:rhodanese-related sulfurtransferase
MNYGPIRSVDVAGLPHPLAEDLRVLDVREQVEWQHGHIAGAQHIPLSELPARVGELGPGRTLVVCKVGGRSAMATSYLQAQGHDVVNLDGGMLDWAQAGRPMVSEIGEPPRVV